MIAKTHLFIQPTKVYLAKLQISIVSREMQFSELSL